MYITGHAGLFCLGILTHTPNMPGALLPVCKVQQQFFIYLRILLLTFTYFNFIKRNYEGLEVYLNQG